LETENKTKDTIMKRPISLTVVALVWFSMGLLGMVGDIVQNNGLHIPNSNFITILVGVGLLRGWRICRWYALFVTGITFVFMVPSAVWAIFNSGELVYHFPFAMMRDQRPHEATSLGIIILFFVSGLIISGWMFWILMRRDVRELFQQKTNSPAPVSI
jgi:hypothetical protein